MDFTEQFLVDDVVSEHPQLNESNKAAWNRLYASTDGLVWGDSPLQFVEEAIRILQAKELLPENPAILDAATGEGRNLPILLNVSPNIAACDASPSALAKLKKRFGAAIETVECDLARMPFQGFSFDMILACDIIETLPNLEEVLLEMRRVLQPSGILVANVPDFDDGISGTDMRPLESGNFLYQGDYFFRFQNENEFMEMMRRCGFSLISCEPATWWEPPHPGFRDHVHSHTSRIIIASRAVEKELLMRSRNTAGFSESLLSGKQSFAGMFES